MESKLRAKTVGTISTGLIAQCFLIITGVLAARTLGVEYRGYLAMLVAFPYFLSMIIGAGLSHSLTYFIARTPSQAASLIRALKNYLVLQIVLIVLVHTIILLAYLPSHGKELVLPAFLMLCAGPAILVHHYVLAILQAKGIFATFNWLRLTPVLGYAFTLMWIFIFEKADLLSVTLAWLGPLLLTAIVGVIVVWIKISRERIELLDPQISIGKVIGYGLKGVVGTSAPLETFRIDQLIAGLFLSPMALGIYVVAQSFSNLPRFISQGIGMVVFPSMASMPSIGDRWALVVRYAMIALVLCGLPAALLLYLVPVLLPFFFGSEFSLSIPIACILLLGALFGAIRNVVSDVLRGMGYPLVSTYAELSVYPCLILAAPYVISHFELLGLALLMASSLGVSLFVSLYVGYLSIRKAEAESIASTVERALRVVAVSHTYLEPEQQKNVIALARYADVKAVVPRQGAVLVFESKTFRLNPQATNLFYVYRPVWIGRSHYFLLSWDLGFNHIRPDAIVVEYNPWSLIFIQVLIYKTIFCRKARVVCFIKKNTYREYSGLVRLIKNIVALGARLVVSHFLAASEAAAKLLVDRLHISPGRVSISHHLGVDLDLFRPGESDRRSGGVNDPLVVGYCGRFDDDKGVDQLVEAVEAVRAEAGMDLRLELVGCGRLDERLLRAAVSRPWLTIRQPIENAKVASFLQTLDIFVLAAQPFEDHEEHDAHALKEAMASGLPCVGTAVGAIPELLRDGVGCIVKPGDKSELVRAIKLLARNPEERATMGRAAREYAKKNLSLDAVARIRFSFLSQIVGLRNVTQKNG